MISTIIRPFVRTSQLMGTRLTCWQIVLAILRFARHQLSVQSNLRSGQRNQMVNDSIPQVFRVFCSSKAAWRGTGAASCRQGALQLWLHVVARAKTDIKRILFERLRPRNHSRTTMFRSRSPPLALCSSSARWCTDGQPAGSAQN
jgi:hypothetical protein